jgi:hypothetical protein
LGRLSIVLFVGEALLSVLRPQISGPLALLGRLMPHLFHTVALVLGEVTSLVHKAACITGLVSLLVRPVAFIRGRQSHPVATGLALKVSFDHDAPPDGWIPPACV